MQQRGRDAAVEVFPWGGCWNPRLAAVPVAAQPLTGGRTGCSHQYLHSSRRVVQLAIDDM